MYLTESVGVTYSLAHGSVATLHVGWLVIVSVVVCDNVATEIVWRAPISIRLDVRPHNAQRPELFLQ